MAITEEQRTLRKRWLGSSDAAAIFGLDDFGRTPVDVYFDKVADMPAGRATKSQEAGNFLERAILDFAEARLGTEIERNVMVPPPPELPFMGANLDGITAAGEVVEAKAEFQHPDLWGDEGSDQVPERVILQTHHQMIVTEAQVAWVPVLLLRTLRLYRVERNDELAEAIIEGERKFWTEHIEAGVPPGEGPPPMDYLRSLRREPETIDLSDEAAELWARLEATKALAKDVKADEETIKRELIDLLGRAEAGRLPDGRLIVFAEQKSTPSVDHARLRAQWPDAARECVRQGTHRTLRIKKAEKGRRAA